MKITNLIKKKKKNFNLTIFTSALNRLSRRSAPGIQPSMKPPHPLCSFHKQPDAHASSRHDRGRCDLPRAACAAFAAIGPPPLGHAFGDLRPRSAGPRQRKTKSGRSLSTVDALTRSAPWVECGLYSLPSCTRATGDRFALPPPVGLLRTLRDLSRSYGDSENIV